MTETNSKQEIVSILTKQNLIMTQIIQCQDTMRKSVVKKDWMLLQDCIAQIETFSKSFNAFDSQRDSLASLEDIYSDIDCRILINALRSKLLKSKIENNALKDYAVISKDFIQQIIEKALPQRRNTLYARNGKIIKPQTESVILNKVL